MSEQQPDGPSTTAESPRPDVAAYAPVSGESQPLVAYQITERGCPLVPASHAREWMLATRKKFANRCLPLLMANQSGWLLLNVDPFEAVWTGGTGPGHMVIRSLREDGAAPELVNGLFGYGVLTWQVPYLFRTPPGWNLVVRGPTNLPKDGIQALDGLVETDWAVATFTMNWQVTRPDHPIRFDEGEPFCMIAPQRRGELERFAPEVRPIQSDRELHRQYETAQRDRELHNAQSLVARRMFGPDVADELGWQRHYFQGTSPGGVTAPVHQTKLSLCPFHAPPAAPDRAGSSKPAPDADR